MSIAERLPAEADEGVQDGLLEGPERVLVVVGAAQKVQHRAQKTQNRAKTTLH